MSLYTQDDFRSLFNVSDDAYEKIAHYHALLLKWNKAINLVSPKTIKESWHRHFIDSAQIADIIPQGSKIYADLGCGGGFPGLVVAMMRPELDVHLVESDERKGQFMRTVIRETASQNITVHTKRIENVTEDFTPDFVTARALASLSDLFDYCAPWLAVNPALGFGFMKGARADEEIEQARIRYNFDLETITSITDNQAQILLVSDLSTI